MAAVHECVFELLQHPTYSPDSTTSENTSNIIVRSASIRKGIMWEEK